MRGRRALRVLGAAGLLVLAVTGYTQVMARLDLVTPPPMAPADARADLIRVDKDARRMTLLRDGAPFAAYEISLRADGDGGPKRREGDERTPEGRYVIDWRNAGSFAHLSLHVSYPDATDVARAEAAGDDPGGFIMIHGLPNGWGWLGRLHLAWDWTDGCIAVSNDHMDVIWASVPNGTPIEIRP